MGHGEDVHILATLRRWGWLLVLAPALAAGVLVSAYVYNVALGGFANMVSASVGGFVEKAAQGTGGDLDSMLARFGPLVAEQVDIGNLVALRVVDASGTIRYSSILTERGTKTAMTPALRAAMANGSVAWSSVPSLPGTSADADPVLKIVGPFRGSPAAPPLAAVELYRPYATVKAGAYRAAAAALGVVLLGALLTYGFLMLIVHNAQRSMARSDRWARSLNERLQTSLRDQEEALIGTLQALTAAVNSKDSYTALHSLHVSAYATAVARALGYPEDEIDRLERAALLHDIGKLGVPEAVLWKRDPLTDEDWHAVREHSPIGGFIIESVPALQSLCSAVRGHHERWDGSGYPDGLAGEAIPDLARLLAVADAFDAMTSDRPYRSAFTVAQAMAELRRGRGSQFDPRVVDAFLAAYNDGALTMLREHDEGGRSVA